MKDRQYYIFWGAAVAVFTVLMASSVVGLQVWLSNQAVSCPTPQATTITVEAIPISIETHEADRSLSRPNKWIDPDNQTVHYMYGDGSGRLIPMYGTVPPMWYENMLKSYIQIHGESMPQEIADAIPWEWKNSVVPEPRPLPKGGNPN